MRALLPPVVLALLAYATAAHAQDLVLRDADAPRVARLLRAERARITAGVETQRRLIADAETEQGFYRGLEAGATDIVDFLRAHSSLVRIPAGARHDAACSRQATVPANVVAVFALDGTNAAAMARVVAAYRAVGIVPRERWRTGVQLAARDREADSLLVGVDTAWAAPEWAPACRALAHRAVMTLRLDGMRYMTPSAGADSAVRDADARLDTEQSSAGLSAEQANTLLSAALLARTDARDLATLDGLARIPDAAMQASIAKRRQNALWWQRHRAELEPLAAGWE